MRNPLRSCIAARLSTWRCTLDELDVRTQSDPVKGKRAITVYRPAVNRAACTASGEPAGSPDFYRLDAYHGPRRPDAVSLVACLGKVSRSWR
jgi:hypothetical protein